MKHNRFSIVDEIKGNILVIFLKNKSSYENVKITRYGQIKWENYEFTDFFVRPSEFLHDSLVLTDNGLCVNDESLKYDAIIIDQCLEYVPDIITFLRNITGYLNDSGKLVLINRDKRYSNTCIMGSSTFSSAFSVYKGDVHSKSALIMETLYHLTYSYDKASYWNSYPISDRNFIPIDRIMKRFIKNGDVSKLFLPYWRFTPREFLIFLQDTVYARLLAVDFEALVLPEQYDDLYTVVLSGVDKADFINSRFMTEVMDRFRNAMYSIKDVPIIENDLSKYYIEQLEQWKTEFYKLKEMYNESSKASEELEEWKKEFYKLKELYNSKQQ